MKILPHPSLCRDLMEEFTVDVNMCFSVWNAGAEGLRHDLLDIPVARMIDFVKVVRCICMLYRGFNDVCLGCTEATFTGVLQCVADKSLLRPLVIGMSSSYLRAVEEGNPLRQDKARATLTGRRLAGRRWK